MDTNNQAHNFIEDSLVILTKQTLDIFLRQEHPSELISLYTFYYYTAKWQKTNQPKCTTNYVAKALHWKNTKVRKFKKQLIEFGLIEDARIVDPKTKKVVGYYIKMNYIFKKETLEKSQGCLNPPSGFENEKNEKARGTQNERVAFSTTNALSVNKKNALSTDKKYIYSSSAKKPIEDVIVNTPINKNVKGDMEKSSPNENTKKENGLTNKALQDEFKIVWDIYLNKKGRAKAYDAFVKARKGGVTFEEIKTGVENYNQEIRAKRIDQQFIKHGDTWFRNRCWEDEYDTNNSSSYDLDQYEKTMDTFAGEKLPGVMYL